MKEKLPIGYQTAAQKHDWNNAPCTKA